MRTVACGLGSEGLLWLGFLSPMVRNTRLHTRDDILDVDMVKMRELSCFASFLGDLIEDFFLLFAGVVESKPYCW